MPPVGGGGSAERVDRNAMARRVPGEYIDLRRWRGRKLVAVSQARTHAGDHTLPRVARVQAACRPRGMSGDTPCLLVRRADCSGASPREANDGRSDELIAFNPTAKAWRVETTAEFREDSGDGLRHAPLTLLPGQFAIVGDIRGRERDSQRAVTLFCEDAAGRSLWRAYYLDTHRGTNVMVPGLGMLWMPEPRCGEVNPATEPPRVVEMRKWALDDNDPFACLSLGMAYAGTSVAMAGDPARAVLWYHHGAVLGDAGCQTELARHCETGDGVPADPANALSWHRNAAQGGEADSALWLALKAADQIEALDWLRHGCLAGDKRCMIGAARLLLDDGGPSAVGEAARWIDRAAELGEPEAQIRLATMLLAEDASKRGGWCRDPDEAAYWLAAAMCQALPPNLRRMAEDLAAVTVRPETNVPPRGGMARALRRLGRMPRPRRPPAVAELRFDDLPRIGHRALQSLLRHCAMADCVWALAPGIERRQGGALRHFFLTGMSYRAASFLVRDILRVETSEGIWDRIRSQSIILDHLRDLVEDGEIDLDDDLDDALERRQAELVRPADIPDAPARACQLWGFGFARPVYEWRHARLARRATRTPPPHPAETPRAGW
ncbi:MAG: sel1 repeat family protein [Alphaproteobacteria bacterium]|nr:sel1 repeat family protein [Alphaproteobacteria bacterium]